MVSSFARSIQHRSLCATHSLSCRFAEASSASLLLLVDKEFIEERRRSLKRYLEILCRHPIICDAEIIKFFLTFQGPVRSVAQQSNQSSDRIV